MHFINWRSLQAFDNGFLMASKYPCSLYVILSQSPFMWELFEYMLTHIWFLFWFNVFFFLIHLYLRSFSSFFYISTYLFTESQNTSLSWTGVYPIVFLLYFSLISWMALGEEKKLKAISGYIVEFYWRKWTKVGASHVQFCSRFPKLIIPFSAWCPALWDKTVTGRK